MKMQLLSRIIPVPSGRCGEGGRVLQVHSKAQVRVPRDAHTVHQRRQEQRAGRPARRRQCGQDPSRRRREVGGPGLHQPRRRVVGPGPLRHLLGAQRRRG